MHTAGPAAQRPWPTRGRRKMQDWVRYCCAARDAAPPAAQTCVTTQVTITAHVRPRRTAAVAHTRPLQNAGSGQTHAKHHSTTGTYSLATHSVTPVKRLVTLSGVAAAARFVLEGMAGGGGVGELRSGGGARNDMGGQEPGLSGIPLTAGVAPPCV